MTFFSVVIPTYNRAGKIPTAIKSVLNQTFFDWELIVVDDGSTDNTAEIIKNYPDKRIFYIHQKNSERSAARNNGILHSRGRYICFLDSDDEYYGNYLMNLYRELEKESFPVGLFRSLPSTELNGNITEHNNIPLSPQINHIDHFLTSYSPVCAICVSSEILVKHKFDTELRYAEDTNLWLRIFKEFPLFFIPVKSCLIHLSNTNSSKISYKYHYEYIDSFSKTFSDPDIRSLASDKIIKNLFLKRFNWLKGMARTRKNLLEYLKALILETGLKTGIIRYY